jgi:peroxiredoxin
VRGSWKRAAQVAAGAGVGVLAALLIWSLTHQTPPPKVGAPAPAFSLRRLTGNGDLSLASYRGRTVVLNFFASWCGPCKREAPALEQIWRQYRARGVVVLGIDSGDAASDARHFLSVHGITYPVAFDHNETQALHYGIPGLPGTFVINRQGRVVGAEIAGPVTDQPFEKDFKRYLDAALKA